MKLPKKAKNATEDKNNHTAKLVKPRDGEELHRDIPHANGADLSNSRMVLMDTGASYGMLNRALAEGRMPESVRKLIRPADVNTANGKTKVSAGIRIRSGPWDCITDALLLNNSPNPSSVGQRVLNAGFTFIWVRKCFPCLIPQCCGMIIIFDLHGRTPCYSPCMEEFEQTMLGSFELRENMFRNTCGIVVGVDGKIYLDLAAVPDAKTDVGQSPSVDVKVDPNSVGDYEGDHDVDKMHVVYTRREGSNAKRFLTLPKAALDK